MVTENKRMFQRRRTSAQWASENPVLGAGEIGVITDEVPSFKIGDGSTAWNSLNTNPDLTTSDVVKVPLNTSGGVTTIDVTNVAWAPLAVRLTADSSAVNNSTTLVDVTGLVLPVASNALYMLNSYIVYSATTVADIKFAFTVPAGADGRWTPHGLGTGTSGLTGIFNATRRSFALEGAVGGAGAGTQASTSLHGVLLTAGTAGNIQLRFAQNNAEATDAIVHQWSTLAIQRIS